MEGLTWPFAAVIIVIVLAVAGLKGCQTATASYNACVEKTSKPLECRAAAGGRP